MKWLYIIGWAIAIPLVVASISWLVSTGHLIYLAYSIAAMGGGVLGWSVWDMFGRSE